MRVCIFASGSTGNCLLVADRNTNILIDAGISARRVISALTRAGLTADDIGGVLASTPPISSAVSPALVRALITLRAEIPASIKIFVFLSATSRQLPVDPLAKIQTLISQ